MNYWDWKMIEKNNPRSHAEQLLSNSDNFAEIKLSGSGAGALINIEFRDEAGQPYTDITSGVLEVSGKYRNGKYKAIGNIDLSINDSLQVAGKFTTLSLSLSGLTGAIQVMVYIDQLANMVMVDRVGSGSGGSTYSSSTLVVNNELATIELSVDTNDFDISGKKLRLKNGGSGNGLGYDGLTSNTLFKLSEGATIFTTNLVANKTAFAAGSRINLASKSDVSKYAQGLITKFDSNQLSVNIDYINGSGTFSDWIISIAGEQGPAGKDGANGKDGAQGPKGDQGIQGPEGKQGTAGKDGSAVIFSGQVVTELQFGSNVDASIKDGVLLVNAKSGGGGGDPKSTSFECTALKVNNASTGLITWQGLSIPALLLAVNGEIPFVFNLDRQYNSGEAITLNIYSEVFNTDSSACNISNLGYSVSGFDAAATNHASGTTTLNIAANEFTSNRKILSIPITFKAACSSVQIFLNNFTGASAKKAGFTNTIRFNWS